MDPVPGPGLPAPQPFTVTEWQRNDLFTNLPVQVRLLRENPRSGALAVELSTLRDFFIKPDLMAYWVAGTPPITGQLPDHARLLGGFDSGVLPLPPEAATNRGVLMLFSLADDEMVGVSKPFPLPRSTE
jgi:hypothetical protein